MLHFPRKSSVLAHRRTDVAGGDRMRSSDLDRAGDLATENFYYNPRPVTPDGIRALLQDAFDGRRPD
jgi:hypothetical protein